MGSPIVPDVGVAVIIRKSFVLSAFVGDEDSKFHISTVGAAVPRSLPKPGVGAQVSYIVGADVGEPVSE